MAFADPQSVTISGSAVTLPRTSSGVNSGVFSKDDGNVKLTVSSAYGKRARRTIRLDHRKIVTDPLVTATNVEKSLSAYLVIDEPLTGYTVAEAKAVADALIAYLSASTGARLTQLLGGEN